MFHTLKHKGQTPALQLQILLAINVTIGDLIVEGPATSIGFRVLDLGTPNTGPKIEASFIGNATIRGGINATDMGTLQTVINSDGTSLAKVKGY
jgi:hypothetical protein